MESLHILLRPFEDDLIVDLQKEFVPQPLQLLGVVEVHGGSGYGL